MNAQTPLQMLAAVLAETAQTAQEMCEAEIARIDADAHAQLAQTAAQMAQCPVMRRSRTLSGHCVR